MSSPEGNVRGCQEMSWDIRGYQGLSGDKRGCQGVSGIAGDVK